MTKAEPVLPIPTSATGVTLVMTGNVTLFVKFVSPVGVLTFATLVNDPEAGAVTVTVRLLIWPLVRLPRLQFTTPPLFTPPPEALTNITFTGRLSVTTTLLAADGPKFVTDI